MAHHPGTIHRVHLHSEASRTLHSRFAGLNIGASFFGWVVASASAMLLVLVLAGAVTAIILAINPNLGDLAGATDAISAGTGILLLLAMGAAYYAGGYVAGRMSRYSAITQGIGVWAIGIFMAVILSAAGILIGAQLDLQSLPIAGNGLSANAMIIVIATLVVTLIASIGGSMVGEHYHQRVDEEILD